ncbi:MAG: BamA/TamA family outer membrane protein [Bacteroidales bacterium]|nr:BamA/TamA family outer membrane protein [Bacteroidales bacterium]
MKYVYNFGIYLLKVFCLAGALFSKKLKAMCSGQAAVQRDLDKLKSDMPTVWFHCASLGEFEQARPLIEYFKQNKPQYQILLTFFSPSGYEVRKNYNMANCVTYLPFDTRKNARQFVQKVAPKAVFFVKYELWWNYIRELQNIPFYSVSLILRKNHYIFKPYSHWFLKQLKSFDMFFVQDENTANLLHKAGFDNCIVTGDTRFDRVYQMSLEHKHFSIIEAFCGDNKVLLAGSSWPEDEVLLQYVYNKFGKEGKTDCKFIIAPHLTDTLHVNKLLDMFDNSVLLSRADENTVSDYGCIIIDSIGILMYLYSVCDIAYIGGGFGEGIHNILEAAVFSKPVAFGPNNKKFREASQLLQSGAACEIKDKHQLCSWAESMLTDDNKRKKFSDIAGKYVRDNVGATAKILKHVSLLIVAIVIMCSCSPNRHLSKDGYLLSKNKIAVNNKTISKGNVINYVQQDPNHKLLGMKMGMYIYSMSRQGDDSTCNFFEKYVLRTVGDKPVEIDDNQTEVSCKNIKTYLKTHGCFDAQVTSYQKQVRRWYAPWSFYNKRRTVVYDINAPNRAVIDTFMYVTEDSALYNTVSLLLKDNPIRKGTWYNEDNISALRTQVAQGMLEQGYYAFAPKYIVFNVDTTQGTDKTKVIMIVKNPASNPDTSANTAGKHKPYKISRIYIQPNYISPTSPDYIPDIDTIRYFHKQQKGYAVTPLYFINNTTQPGIKAKSIMRCILMQNNNLFSPSASANTYSSLFQLRNFKYIDISYEDITDKIKDTNDLACYIRLTRNKPVSLSSSFEFNYSANNNAALNDNSSNLGMEGNLAYTDKNLLHGAEIFSTNLKLAAEINSNVFKKGNTNSGWDIFNAFEAGLDAGIELPRFLAPFSTSFYSMKFHPHTSIKTGYNIQKRYYYERSIFNLNYGYSWNTSDKKYFSFIPLEVNYVNMTITDNNYAEMIKTMDKRIQYQMSDHLVMAMRFSYVYNGQTVNQKENFRHFTLNVETAGNVLDLYSMAFNLSKDGEDHYTIFNIPFSQYVRSDVSFIKYKYLTKKTSFVYKIYGGAGYCYGNAQSLPYEKAFFGGGANNIRAWQLRALGPGSSKPTGNMRYDRAGDMALGASFEYRFPVAGPLEGAAFVDMGNIWTLNDQQGLEGGKISKDFYKELATGIGLGARIDIQVFILRFDFAVKAWDPAKETEDRFVLNNTKFKDINVQFGIGYPF